MQSRKETALVGENDLCAVITLGLVGLWLALFGICGLVLFGEL